MSEKAFNDLMAVLNGLRSDFQEMTRAITSLESSLGRGPEHISSGVSPESLPNSKKESTDIGTGPRPNVRRGR